MAQRAGVSFELEALDLEDDRLIVTGHWSGVRGLRFVRPMLVADDRRILATLEHKPWAPSPDRAWVAAFPWEGTKLDVDTLTLAVAPQVTVALIGAPLDEPRPDPTPATAPVAPIPAPEPLRDEPAPEPEPELPPAAAAPARPKRTRRVAALEAELGAATRERDEVQRDLEHALAQRDDAVAERDDAVRARARIELEHAEALQARAAAEAALAVAQEQRDEAAAQRDELLLAYRELQVELDAERAEAERAPAAPAPDGEAGPAVALGTRTLATARTAIAQMQRTAAPASRLPFSMLDLWVMRALGTVAVACCVLLLVSLLRVFI